MVEACRNWRTDPLADALLTELEHFGAGAPLEACPALEAVFTGPDEAERLIGMLSQHLCAAIVGEPFGHPPFRSGFDGRAASLLLARKGRAQLIIQTREPGTYKQPTCLFNDAVRYDAVIGGKAQGRIVRLVNRAGQAAQFCAEPMQFARGGRLALDLASETLLLDRVERRLVVLRLLRNAENPAPGREYDAGTGAFLHQSAGSLAISRQEATIALLGRMGRTDAAPACARLALGEGDASLRWQALRECLSLDSATGFAALCRLAQRLDDDLSHPAAALRMQLLETYPQLMQVETDQCRA